MQFDALQGGERGLEPVPDPDGYQFAGGVVEAGYIVHALMVQFGHHWFYDAFQFGKIDDPTQFGIRFSFQPYAQAIGMTVHFPAFMSLRDERQEVGGVEGEFFVE